MGGLEVYNESCGGPLKLLNCLTLKAVFERFEQMLYKEIQIYIENKIARQSIYESTKAVSSLLPEAKEVSSVRCKNPQMCQSVSSLAVALQQRTIPYVCIESNASPEMT